MRGASRNTGLWKTRDGSSKPASIPTYLADRSRRSRSRRCQRRYRHRRRFHLFSRRPSRGRRPAPANIRPAACPGSSRSRSHSSRRRRSRPSRPRLLGATAPGSRRSGRIYPTRGRTTKTILNRGKKKTEKKQTNRKTTTAKRSGRGAVPERLRPRLVDTGVGGRLCPAARSRGPFARGADQSKGPVHGRRRRGRSRRVASARVCLPGATCPAARAHTRSARRHRTRGPPDRIRTRAYPILAPTPSARVRVKNKPKIKT